VLWVWHGCGLGVAWVCLAMLLQGHRVTSGLEALSLGHRQFSSG